MDNWTRAFVVLAYLRTYVKTHFLELYALFLVALCVGPSLYSGNGTGVLVGICFWSLIVSTVFIIVPPQRRSNAASS